MAPQEVPVGIIHWRWPERHSFYSFCEKVKYLTGSHAGNQSSLL